MTVELAEQDQLLCGLTKYGVAVFAIAHARTKTSVKIDGVVVAIELQLSPEKFLDVMPD